MNHFSRPYRLLISSLLLLLAAACWQLPLPAQPTPTPGKPTRPAPGLPTTAPGPAALIGSYDFTRLNGDGSRSAGLLTFKALGPGYLLEWNENGASRRGLALYATGALAASGSNDCGVILYSRFADRSLAAQWLDWSGKPGMEYARPANPAAENYAGVYQVNGYNADATNYAGTLEIKKTEKSYTLYWKTGQTAYAGIGLEQGEYLLGAFGEGCRVYTWQINSDGSLTGTFAVMGDARIGQESARKK